MKITSYNHHAKAPSFPRSLSPQTKTTGSIEPSLLSHQSFALFAKGGCVRNVTSLQQPAPLEFHNADGPETILRFGRSPFHHLQLLPEKAHAGNILETKSIPPHSGRGTPAISFRDTRIRDHARALPYADQRTTGGNSIDRDAGVEAAFCASASQSSAKP